MVSVGTFCDWLTQEMLLTAIVPTGAVRPAYPYITVTPIVTNHPGAYQIGKEQIGNNAATIYFPEKAQFSVTVIDSAESGTAELKVNELRDLLFSQKRKDFFATQDWAFRMVTPPAARFLTADDFSEERYGLDIEIRKTHTITDAVESIGQVTVSDVETLEKINPVTVTA